MSKRWLALFVGIVFLPCLCSSVIAAGNEPIILGAPGSLGFLEGYESANGAQLAVDEINAKGGVNVGGTMRPFKMIKADTRDAGGVAVSEALLAYEKLILQNKPDAIVTGFFTSEATMASMDITSKHKLPYLCTTAMSPKMQKKVLDDYNSYKYFFRLCYNAVYFVKSYLGVLKMINQDFGFDKVFILTEEALWAKAIGGMTAKWAKGQGWKVTGHQTFPKGTTDFSPTLLKMKSTDTRIIVFICSTPASVIFADQWRTMKIPALLTGILPPLCGEDVWKVHKGKVEGIINVVEAGCLPSETIPESVVFYNAYIKKFGKPPGSSHGPGAAYDAIYILKESIEKVGSLDPDKLVSEIEKTDRKGTIGRIRFGKDHQVIFGTNPQEEAMIFDYQWQKPGKRVIVYPKSVATGKIQLPPWMSKK